MQKVVIKRNPYKFSFRERLARFLGKIFKERTFIVGTEGRLVQYRFSSATQSVIFLFILSFVGWSAFATREYITNYDDIQNRHAQVQEARDRFDAAMGELKAYRAMTDAARARLEELYDTMASMLERTDRDRFMRERVRISAEADFVSAQMMDFLNTASFGRLDRSDGYRSTRAELERNLVVTENVALQRRNIELETSMHDMTELQTSLLDQVGRLASSGLDEIERTLSRIDTTLAQANLRDRNTLAARARREATAGTGMGGRFIPVPDVTLSDPALNARFRETIRSVYLWEGLSGAKAMLPLGTPIENPRITSRFGVRSDPFTRTPAMHTGIDFAGRVGTPLYATAPGTVIFVGYRGDYGLTIEINHGLGFSTLYGHLSQAKVNRGDFVEDGQIVGLVGNSGRSTAPHLHYELRHNGRPLNPYAFFRARR